MRKKLTLEINADSLRATDVHLALMRASFMLTPAVVHAGPTVIKTEVQGIELTITIEEVP